MKKNFLTGLLILIPIALTFVIVEFFINLLTTPFMGLFQSVFNHFSDPSQFGHSLLLPLSKLIILGILISFIVFIGFTGRIWFVKKAFMSFDYLVHRTPVISKIYTPLQETVHSFIKPDGTGFSHAVLAPFPYSGSYCVGFVAENKSILNGKEKQLDKIAVFIPGTPNPTAGFMLMYDLNELIKLEMSVDEAMKFLISFGGIIPEGKTITEL